MIVKPLTMAAAALCLAGCISLLPEPPPPSAIYSLRAGPVEPLGGAPKPLVLAVAEPTAPRSVSGADIVWRRDSTIAFMEGAVWDGAAPDLLQAMLVDVMDRRCGVRAVVRADAEVRWDILAFEVVEDGSRLEARIETVAQLLTLRDRMVVAHARFDATAPISSRSGRAAAAALERVATEAAIKTADWAVATAQVQPSAASTSR